jgi:hypothetical protein
MKQSPTGIRKPESFKEDVVKKIVTLFGGTDEDQFG